MLYSNTAVSFNLAVCLFELFSIYFLMLKRYQTAHVNNSNNGYIMTCINWQTEHYVISKGVLFKTSLFFNKNTCNHSRLWMDLAAFLLLDGETLVFILVCCIILEYFGNLYFWKLFFYLLCLHYKSLFLWNICCCNFH